MSRFLSALLGSAFLAGASAPALAQSAEPFLLADGDDRDIVVPGERRTLSDAEAELDRVPGGVDIAPFESYENRLAVSFADTLRLSPGVIADPRFAEEVRLSIRGSGLSRGFHMRGIVLRLDGVPVNLADGASDFQEIDPLAASHIEVYRGANGLRYGAASLGGAVNLATPTARDVDAPLALRLEGGSFGTARANARFGAAGATLDLFGSATQTQVMGFRDHLETRSTRASFNGGWQNAWGETRATLNLNEINQELPGSLTRSQALTTPKMAAPASVTGDQARDIRSTRAAIRHSFDLAGADAEIGAWGFSKSLYHPIFQVIHHDSVDWGAFFRLEGRSEGALRRWTLGTAYTRGENDADQFVNLAGQRGALTQGADQVAETLEAYGEIELGLSDGLSAVVGAQAIRTARIYRRSVPSILNADETFDAFNPKLGFLWRADEGVTVYGNVSRSFEAPTFSEYVQSGAVQPVSAQTAWTAELGARGELGPVLFDAALYRANVEDEMLQYSVDPNHPAATFNADETVHIGLEAFAQWTAIETDAGALTLTGAYTWSDFKFDGDPQFGANRLAGAAEHQFHGELTWRGNSGWFISPNVNWIPGDVVVDYANTTTAPGYTVWGLSAGLDIGNARLFLDARNLTDENYIATFSTAPCLLTTPTCTSANTNPALYYPGETRALYAGVTLRFGS